MPEPDPQWELRAFRLGAKVTWAMAVASLIYVVTTWSQPHRDWLSAITVAAALDGAVVWSLAGHWRAMQRYATRVMTAWNAAHVLAALALCAADGGSASPYVAVFFVSVGFAAVALPRTNVRALALLDSAALVVAGVLFGGSEPALVVLVAGIGATAGVCATIADERLGRIA